MIRMHKSILTLTCTATAICEAYDLIGFDDAPITADDIAVKGVAMAPATAVGLDVGLHAIGPIQMIADGVIPQGSPVISSANGGVKVAPADPENAFATAMTAAADGDLVTILMR